MKSTSMKVASVVVVLLLAVGCGRKSDSTSPAVPADVSARPEENAAAVTPKTDSSSNLPEFSASVSPEGSTSPPQPAPAAQRSVAVDPQQLRDEALAALESGDSGEALRLIRRSVAGDPEDPEALFVMARVLAERNRFAEAIRMLDGLAERMPGLEIPVLGQTAEWSVFQGQWEEAERRYRALREEVDDAGRQMVDRRLAQLLLRQGRRLDANVHLQRLCRGGNIGVS
jgi:tetratricopeptide (TPR) repeat protein